METDKHYLRVGTFVLLTIFVCALFSVWLEGMYNASKYAIYRIRFAESVSGLDIGGEVKFRGVKIGKVETMSIDPSDVRMIQVDVSILKTAPIKTDTIATLKLQGITGSVYVELTSEDSQAAELASNNDKDNPTEIPSKPGTLNAIMDMLPEIMKKVSHIADQIEKLFSDKNVAAVSSTIGNVQRLSKKFAPAKEEPEQ